MSAGSGSSGAKFPNSRENEGGGIHSDSSGSRAGNSVIALNQQLIGAPYRGIIAGLLSGASKVLLGHPFDTLKVRMQTDGNSGRFKGLRHCFRETVKNEGFRALYKGVIPPLVGWGLIDTVLIGTYVNVREHFLKSKNAQGKTLEESPISHHFLAGSFAGFTRAFVATPIELIKARLQVHYAKQDMISGTISCIRQVKAKNGLLGFYTGLGGSILFGCCIGIHFGTYEWLNRYTKESIPDDHLRNFLTGGLAANLFWTVAFPFDSIRNRIMVQQADSKNPAYTSVLDCIRKVKRNEGIRGFYRGFSSAILRSFPVNGSSLLLIEATLRNLP